MAPRQLNPHIALSVAALTAHRQLAAKPPAFYDVEHYNEVLNMVAHALMRVAAPYVADADGGERRALSEADLAGASVRRGATLLVLADGRSFRHVSLLRDDLHSAIALLARTGITGFSAQRAPR